MAELKGSDFIKAGFLDKEIKKMEKFRDTTVKSMSAIKKSAKGVAKELENVSGAQKEGQKTIEKSEKQTEQLVKAQNKYEQSLTETNQELVRLKAAQSQQNQVNKLTEKLNRSLEGSYDKLSAQYGLNKIKLNQMSKAEREATKSGQRLEKNTKDIFNRMNSLQKATGKATLQVGQYGRANAFATSSLRSLASALGFTGAVFALVSAFRNAIRSVIKFEKQNAILAGVLGKTREETKDLSNDAKNLGSITAKSATEVTKLQIAYSRLGFTQSEILELTKDTINGSIALNAELDETAELVGAMIKTFEDLETTDAGSILDEMTLATQKTALQFDKLQTALPIVAKAADKSGVSFTQLLALLGKLSDSGIDASSSATALRNIFLESAAQGLSYDQILTKISNSTDELNAANQEFGKRAAVSASVLADNIAQVRELDEVLQDAGGTAEKVAREQLNTLDGKLTLLSSAWGGLILSISDGDGVLAAFAKSAIDFTTDFVNGISNIDLMFRVLFKDLDEISNKDLNKLLDLGIETDSGIEVKSFFDELEKIPIDDLVKGIDKYRDSFVKALKDEGEVAEEATAIFNAWFSQKEIAFKAQRSFNSALKAGITNFDDFNKQWGKSIRFMDQNNERIELVRRLYRKFEEQIKKDAEIFVKSELEKGEALEKRRKAMIALIRENEKLAASADELHKLNAKRNARRDKETLAAGKALIDQTHELRLSEIDLIEATEQEKTLLRLDAEKKRLEAIIRLNEVFSGELTAIQIQTMRNVIEGINKELNTARDSGNFNNIFEVFGISFSEDQAMNDRIVGFTQVIVNSIMQISMARVQSADIAVRTSETEVQAAQRSFDEQQRLLKQGERADIEGASRRLNNAKVTNKIALKEQEKARRNQERINTATQISSVITASANIFKGWSTLPFVGHVLGAAAVASMIGAFVASKVTAKRATKLGKGGSFDVGGGTHASGNDTFIGSHGGVDHFAEKGEVQGVVSSKSVRKYGSGNVKDVINSLNKGIFEKKYGNVFTPAAQMPIHVMNNVGTDNSDMKKFMASENQDLINTIKRMPQSNFYLDEKGYRRTIRTGQTTVIDSEIENDY